MRTSVLIRKAMHSSFAICAVFAVTMTVPNLSRAEGFFDLYGGVPFAQSAQVDHQFFGDPAAVPPPAPISTTKDVDFSTSWTAGGRVGYWFNTLPWLGLAADLSYFERKGSGADIDLVPLSFLVMLRYPMLTSDSFPKGRLQPYAGVGPSLFFSHTSVNFDPPLQNVNHDSFDVGFDARAGTLWQITKALGLFLEYRFTYVKLDFEKKACVPGNALQDPLGLACLGDNPPEVTISTTQTTLNTHHILVGVRF